MFSFVCIPLGLVVSDKLKNGIDLLFRPLAPYKQWFWNPCGGPTTKPSPDLIHGQKTQQGSFPNEERW